MTWAEDEERDGSEDSAEEKADDYVAEVVHAKEDSGGANAEGHEQYGERDVWIGEVYRNGDGEGDGGV